MRRDKFHGKFFGVNDLISASTSKALGLAAVDTINSLMTPHSVHESAHSVRRLVDCAIGEISPANAKNDKPKWKPRKMTNNESVWPLAFTINVNSNANALQFVRCQMAAIRILCNTLCDLRMSLTYIYFIHAARCNPYTTNKAFAHSSCGRAMPLLAARAIYQLWLISASWWSQPSNAIA